MLPKIKLIGVPYKVMIDAVIRRMVYIYIKGFQGLTSFEGDH